MQDLHDTTFESLSPDGRLNLTSPPDKGDLEIRGVLESNYAFA
jgi:hypothetical protein